MDELPSELYEEIMDRLHLIDLVKLRRVCKRLYWAVQMYRIRELVISSADSSKGEYQNSPIHRPRNLRRTMPSPGSVDEYSAYDIFLRSGQYNVHFLKSLTFDYSDSPKRLGLNEVNKLLQLERLQIKFDSFQDLDPDHDKLSLPNLRTLLLDYNNHCHSFMLKVEAAKCEGLHLRRSFNGITQGLRVHFLNSVDSVKQLSLYIYDESSHIFKNIEFLQVVYGAHLLDERTFAAFPRLECLKIIEHSSLDGLRRLFELCTQHNVRLTFHGI